MEGSFFFKVFSAGVFSKFLRTVLKRMPNWKAPGPDGVQGFWLKILQACISI